MNERIKELIKQHEVDITIDGMGYGEGNVEGFAELIVRECANIAETAEPFKSSDLILSQFGLSHVIQS